jgi:exosome complex exonuclease DIS3/RRP44
MNRAIDGDVVVIEMLPEADWKAPGQEVLDQDGEAFCTLTVASHCLHVRLIAAEALKNDDADDEEGEIQETGQVEGRLEEIEQKTAADAAQKNAVEKRPTGKVVGIVKRNWRS